MKIAIIGWGSLIKNSGDLRIDGQWKKNGPKLKLEFSRVSKDCRLTLVIDDNHGEVSDTLHTLSTRLKLEDAIADLRTREGTIWKWIGYVDVKNKVSSQKINSEQIDVCDNIAQWVIDNKYDAVIWTALKSNFYDQTRKPFSIDNAITYLKSLPTTAQKNALDYFRDAPETVITPLRNKLKELSII